MKAKFDSEVKELLYRNSMIKSHSEKMERHIKALVGKVKQQEELISHTRTYFKKRETQFNSHSVEF